MIKYLIIISALFTACGTSNTTHAPVVIYDTTHKTWCCRYDTIKKDTTVYKVKIVPIPVDSPYNVGIPIDSPYNVPKPIDSIYYVGVPIDSPYTVGIPIDSFYTVLVPNYIPYDTTVYRFINLYTDNILRKYLNNGNQVQVKFTIQYK